MTKECNFCHAIKPLDQFRHGAKCRDCERIYDFNRREKKAEYLKEWVKKNTNKVTSYEEKRAQKRRYGPHIKIYVRTCVISGEKFIAKSPSQKVKPCFQKQYIQQVNKRNWDGLRVEMTCPECGELYRATSAFKYCSIKCCRIANARHSKAKIKADKYGTHVIDKIHRFILFEKYKWKCAVCDANTPKELVGTCSPNSPTVDHIIPYSKGGDHSYANCQLLCFACNCSKNDAIDPPDELVIAGNLLITLNHTIHEAERRTVECH